MQKRDLPTQSPDERDGTQRSLGFVGLSAIAHSALLIGVLLAPSFKTQMGEIAGNEAGATLEMKGETSATAEAAANASQTTEVLLADANDLTAAALPVEAKPIEAAQVPAPKPKVAPAIIEEDIAVTEALVEARKKIQPETPAETKVAANEPAKTAQLDSDDADDEKVEEPADDTPTTEAGPSAIVNAKPDAAAGSAGLSQNLGTTSSTTSGASTPAGTATGTTTNSSGNSPGRLSVPLGVPIRDARSLIAMNGNAKPVYPLPDKLAGRQGTTVLVGSIRADGSVAQVAIEKSSGSRMMDESAAKAFKGWRYQAGQEGFVRLPVQFQLVGDAKEVPARLKRQ